MAVSRRVQTLLFTDIVGSTDRLRDLGDAAWAALLARHDEVMRAVLASHGGREVETRGDGLLARFDAPALALRAAVAAAAAVARLGIEIRAGLHTSEVQLHGDVMTGVGVHLAARILAEADPGQVLVSATIRELMAGSGLVFVDLGVRELKGFPERWRLYALDPVTVQAGEAGLETHELAVGNRDPTAVPFPGLVSVGRVGGQARARRRRLVPVAAILLAATIGVLGAWISRPRSTDASVSPRSTEARISTLDVLVADFRPLGFTPPEHPEHIDLASLPYSRSFDNTQKRWLRESGVRRVLVMKFTHPKGGRLLELRIFEVRGSAEALRLQQKFSICSSVEGTKTFQAPRVTGSKGTECDVAQGRIQEVTFTRGPRLFKLKLWGLAPPRSRDLILELARVEAAIAR
jgi:class 3 adenylate cyclase